MSEGQRAMRLRTQLMLLYGVVAVLVYALSILGIHHSVSKRFEEFSRQENERRQTDFVRLIASFVSDDEPLSQQAVRAVRGAMRRYGVRDARIYDLREKLILNTHGAAQGARGDIRGDTQIFPAIPLQEYTAVLQAEDKDVGRITFTAHVRRTDFIEQVFMDGVRSTLVIGSCIAILLLCAISWLVSRSIARPLEAASQAAARIANGESGVRIGAAAKRMLLVRGVPAAREVAALTESFNGMADALQLKESLRTRMTSDIAHELRTPVSVLKAHLEGVRDGVLTMDTAELGSLLDETGRLEKIITDLRSIWELENSGLPLQCVPLAIDPFLQRVAERFRPLADEKGMKLELSAAGPGLSVLADSAALNRVFDNLMQNALKYGRENGTIALDARRDGARVCIRVLDDGPGISEEALPLIFERFYRADEARARKSGGAGLGLAIAREAVEACGGSILAANRSTNKDALSPAQRTSMMASPPCIPADDTQTSCARLAGGRPARGDTQARMDAQARIDVHEQAGEGCLHEGCVFSVFLPAAPVPPAEASAETRGNGMPSRERGDGMSAGARGDGMSAGARENGMPTNAREN